MSKLSDDRICVIAQFLRKYAKVIFDHILGHEEDMTALDNAMLALRDIPSTEGVEDNRIALAIYTARFKAEAATIRDSLTGIFGFTNEMITNDILTHFIEQLYMPDATGVVRHTEVENALLNEIGALRLAIANAHERTPGGAPLATIDEVKEGDEDGDSGDVEAVVVPPPSYEHNSSDHADERNLLASGVLAEVLGGVFL